MPRGPQGPPTHRCPVCGKPYRTPNRVCDGRWDPGKGLKKHHKPTEAVPATY